MITIPGETGLSSTVRDCCSARGNGRDQWPTPRTCSRKLSYDSGGTSASWEANLLVFSSRRFAVQPSTWHDATHAAAPASCNLSPRAKRQTFFNRWWKAMTGAEQSNRRCSGSQQNSARSWFSKFGVTARFRRSEPVLQRRRTRSLRGTATLWRR